MNISLEVPSDILQFGELEFQLGIWSANHCFYTQKPLCRIFAPTFLVLLTVLNVQVSKCGSLAIKSLNSLNPLRNSKTYEFKKIYYHTHSSRMSMYPRQLFQVSQEISHWDADQWELVVFLRQGAGPRSTKQKLRQTTQSDFLKIQQ